MLAAAPAASRPAFRAVGDNDVRSFGLTPAERAHRFAAKARIVGEARGPVVLANFEGAFLQRLAMDIHVWQRIDSRFRPITARRNPNMVILVAAMLFGRPDFGLIAVAEWTVLSLVVHLVRWSQAKAAHANGSGVRSWLG